MLPQFTSLIALGWRLHMRVTAATYFDHARDLAISGLHLRAHRITSQASRMMRSTRFLVATEFADQRTWL